jgi:hypothetical protein
VQAIYENARREALENLGPPSWALDRVRQYGVAGLFPGSHNDFPFMLYRQTVPRPAWSGKRDFHRDRLHQVYEFLLTVDSEIREAEPVGNIFNGLDASGGVAAREVSLGVDNCPPGVMRDFDFLLQGVD